MSNSCKLPESPQKQALIQFLNESIRNCDLGIEAEGGTQWMTQAEREYIIERDVYRKILRKIQ